VLRNVLDPDHSSTPLVLLVLASCP
jgi:hypothetical protein